MILKSELSVLKELVRYRLFSAKSTFIDELINMIIWVSGTILVMGYLMQSFGLKADFGIFMFGGIVAVLGIFELWPMIANLLVDIEGDNLFGYHASLACSLHTVFLAYIFAQTFYTVLLSLLILPLGKVLLWNQLVITNISWVPLLGVIIVANLLFATLALWTASIVGSMEKIGNVWMRVIWPMWFFGGFQFSYESTKGVWPMFSYIMLINPVTYATEGVRSALVGGNFLNSWLCIGVLLLFGFVMFFDSIRRFRNRLDLV